MLFKDVFLSTALAAILFADETVGAILVHAEGIMRIISVNYL